MAWVSTISLTMSHSHSHSQYVSDCERHTREDWCGANVPQGSSVWHSDPTVILSVMTYIQRRILCLGLGDPPAVLFYYRNSILHIIWYGSTLHRAVVRCLICLFTSYKDKVRLWGISESNFEGYCQLNCLSSTVSVLWGQFSWSWCQKWSPPHFRPPNGPI